MKKFFKTYREDENFRVAVHGFILIMLMFLGLVLYIWSKEC